jgi:hypothetical protein
MAAGVNAELHGFLQDCYIPTIKEVEKQSLIYGDSLLAVPPHPDQERS